jgi:hypothetical protein
MDINAVTFLIGPIIFGGFFISGGLNHFTKRAMYTQYAASKHVPSPGAAIIVSGLMLVLGGASVLFGLWPRKHWNLGRPRPPAKERSLELQPTTTEPEGRWKEGYELLPSSS